MDLLCNAYSTASGEGSEEPNPKPKPKPYLETLQTILSSKRFKPSPSISTIYNASKSEVAALGSVLGRYISKRERYAPAAAAAASSSVSSVCDFCTASTHSSAILSPVRGSLSDSDIQHDVLLLLRHHKKGHGQSSVPERFSVSLIHHTKAVNSIQWSPTHVCSPFSCFCWNGSCNLYMECLEQRSEEGTPLQLSQCRVTAWVVPAFLWI